MDAFHIVVSSHLKSHPVARFLAELGVDLRYTTLRRGNFVVAGKFGIKYFSSDEFVKAVKDRSIYREVLELKREFSDPIIIVEGDDPFHNSEVSLSTVYGAVLFASVPNRVPILMTGNDIETAQMLFMMSAQTSNSVDWKMANAANGETPAFNPGDNGHGDPRLTVIAGLPEVGPALAAGLLKHFGSLSKLFAARVKDLTKVEGIGPKKAEKIYAFLNGKKRNKAA